MRLKAQKTPADTLLLMTLAGGEMEDIRNVVHYFERRGLRPCVNMFSSKFTERNKNHKGMQQEIGIKL